MGLGGIIAKRLIEEGAKVILIDTQFKITEMCKNQLGENAKAMDCNLFDETKCEKEPFIDERGRNKYNVNWIYHPALNLVRGSIK